LHLLAGDRLEPSHYLADISKFESMVPSFEVSFWRPSNETICKHRCPLCSVEGVSTRTLAPDTLHTLYLGVYKAFCVALFWALILCDAWATNASTADVRAELSVHRLRHDLFAWYRDEHAARPQERLYELGDLTMNMLGTSTHAHLSTKAAETGTLLGFARDLARRFRHLLGERGNALVIVGDTLVELRDLIRNSPPRLSPATAQRMIDLAKRAMVHRQRANIPFTPKWHLMLHIG